jgi:glyoxylase-like metal-dependent hydrolase (beta-lactamase superfamily II)
LRAVALHPDVLIATSAVWQTNCAVVRGGQEAFLVDSPILPDELQALGALIEQAGFPAPCGLLATHGDWDHLLGRLAFPGLALGCAETTALRMQASPGVAQRELRAFDEEYLIERQRPLALGAVQALPVPGRCGIGELELELHPTDGHTRDGMALWVPWARVLLAGDYLSAVEIPTLNDAADAAGKPAPTSDASQSRETGDALGAYLATLERMRPLVQEAEHIVPGHGPVLSSERALAVLEEHLAYLRALREQGGATESITRSSARRQAVR